MNYKADRGGRVAIAFADDGGAVARRLTKALQGYRPPPGVAGEASDFGFAPSRLEASLLPRLNSARDIDLPAAVRTSLREADHLIVLCTAGAVEDRFVDEEIRTFQAFRAAEGVEGRLHLARSSGEAAAPPAAVEAEARVVADFRTEQDGWSEGLDKLRAAALGVPVERLQALEKRRRQRSRAAALVAVGVLIFACVAFWPPFAPA